MGEFRNIKDICPYCWLPAVPILYGYPRSGAAELMHIGRAVGGGCVIDMAMPTLSCPRHHRWRPPDHGSVVLPSHGGGPLEDFAIAAARTYLRGDPVEAERVYREAVGLLGESPGPSHEETLRMWHALAIVLYAAGRPADGETEYRAMRAAEGYPLSVSAVRTAEEVESSSRRPRQRRRELERE
ncbi:hypothetical protein Ait01nite_101220 [Actinoplanes italicus]|uniref:Tetratricopeptide repeat protein n=1 Tax=Actinoplanes italicus TaxID=113567 RepID=A0A2T0K464_9ACTN|nr:tetratricopeptide repeat protein [Actinoplanes italicus]PRX17658.1 hypothetical protein CLV67_115161 [Actinoplanes italicus]GIE37077.1 hypothetical protein Ait01nite_101220 [Actinoplanes italicus]